MHHRRHEYGCDDRHQGRRMTAAATRPRRPVRPTWRPAPSTDGGTDTRNRGGSTRAANILSHPAASGVQDASARWDAPANAVGHWEKESPPASQNGSPLAPQANAHNPGCATPPKCLTTYLIMLCSSPAFAAIGPPIHYKPPRLTSFETRFCTVSYHNVPGGRSPGCSLGTEPKRSLPV